MKRSRSPSISTDEPSSKKSRTTPSEKQSSRTKQTSPLHGQNKAAIPPSSVPTIPKDCPVESLVHSPVADKTSLQPTTNKSPSTGEVVTGPVKRPLSPSTSRETPRPRKRPGGAARIDHAAKEVVLQRQQAREREAKEAAATRGVHDVVRQHYNAVPQRGREWRRTDSRIKGLRGFNNWVKSTIIHKFSPNTDGSAAGDPLLVLDIGCGKGGDLAKWAQAPQDVALYVGIDPAEVSIEQARERYGQMGRGGGRGGRGGRGGYGSGRPQRTFDAEFIVQDAFGQSIGNIPIVRNVGFDAKGGSRWGGGGFDVVSMMFCMHYAFEDEGKARGMLLNIAGALKKGGKFIGTMPNSDILREKVTEFHKQQALNAPKPQANGLAKAAAQAVSEAKDDDSSAPQTLATETEPSKARIPTPDIADNEAENDTVAHWGNSIYQVRFPGKTPPDGIFRPPFGWKYNYFLDEAVEVPEYVVPWEAFRALAEDYNLELQYRRTFPDIWKEEKDDPVFRPLSERMGVLDRISGEMMVTHEEMEAVGFYHAFCFYKV
ncbi:mRNA cap guanine-N7 methyltransferase [Xanthoria parietina]